MDTLLQDLRFALRTLLRKPGLSLAAVLALGLGIAGNSVIFSVVNGLLLKPPPWLASDRVVRVFDNYTKQGEKHLSISLPEYRDFAARTEVFSAVSVFQHWNVNLAGRERPERVEGARVTASLFDVLQTPPMLGRTFTADEDRAGGPPVVVVGYDLWQRRYNGDAGIIGRSARVNGATATVIGVMPRGFDFPKDTQLWAPLAPDTEALAEANRGQRHYKAIARLQPDVSLEQAQASLDVLGQQFQRLAPDNYPAEAGYRATVMGAQDYNVRKARPALLVLSAAVALVLLIACANVASLQLARAVARQKELAIRAALGAGRRRIARQLLVECLLLATLGGAVGLLLALWGVDLLSATIPADSASIRDAIRLDPRVVAFTAFIALGSGVLFGALPAIQASSPDVLDNLKESGGTGGPRGRARLRNVLVVAEVALALVLLIGAGLMIRSFGHLQQLDPGIETEGVLTARVSLPPTTYADDASKAAFFRRLLTRLEALPGVQAAGASSSVPFGGMSQSSNFQVEGRTYDERNLQPHAEITMVSPGYFQAMGIPLLKGRYLTAQDEAPEARGVVIDRALAELHFPGEEAIGRRINVGGGGDDTWLTVVGVVGSVRQRGLEEESLVQLYWPIARVPVSDALLVLRTSGDPKGLSDVVRRELAGVDADLAAFGVRSMDELVDNSLRSQKLAMTLLSAFAVLALLLASLGVYGMMSWSVSRRTRELGVRIALGAEPRHLVRMVIGEGLRLTVVGIALGLVGAFALGKAMSSLLVGVSATDPWTWGGLSALLALVALVASWLPARRATRVAPVTALKYE